MAQQRYDHYTALHDCEDPSAHFGITTGLTGLANLLTGLQSRHLMVLAGRPRIGKTAFALNIARNVTADQEKSVANFSLESPTSLSK